MTDTTTIQETKVLWDKSADKLYVWDDATKAWELFFVAADLVTNDALTGDLALKVDVAGDTMTGALQVPAIGVNATPDVTNKLSVNSAAILFNNIADHCRIFLNKAAAVDTASTLYEDGFSGRAEVGLCGDDNFHFKVSPDGSSWTDAIIIDKSTGHVGLGTALPDAPLTIDRGTGTAAPGTLSVTPFVHLMAPDATAAALYVDGYGSNAFILFRAALGTRASPVAVTAGQSLGSFNSQGWDGSAWGSAAAITFRSEEAFNSSSHGSSIELANRAPGTTGAVLTAKSWGDGRFMRLGAELDMSYSRQTPTTAFSLTVGDSCGRLILNPAGTLAAGTITMAANPKDGQICILASSKAITALSVRANSGQTILGGFSSASFAANGFAAWTYVASDTAWYRTG